jgi:flagellar P-ring protein precursor FlgI
LLLREPDFAVARDAASAINRNFDRPIARAVDGSRIEINGSGLMPDGISSWLARIGDIPVPIPSIARVVVNERTGTVVLGKDVSLGACSILQGSLAVNIITTYEVSQPGPFSQGTTVVVPQTTVEAKETPAQTVRLKEGATVEDLIRGLQAIGATARDIVAILQAIKAAGALQAELEVI